MQSPPNVETLNKFWLCAGLYHSVIPLFRVGSATDEFFFKWHYINARLQLPLQWQLHQCSMLRHGAICLTCSCFMTRVICLTCSCFMIRLSWSASWWLIPLVVSSPPASVSRIVCEATKWTNRTWSDILPCLSADWEMSREQIPWVWVILGSESF